MKFWKKLLSTALAVTMIFGMVTVPASATATQETKARVLHALGLFKGYDDTGANFGLADGVTREQALVFLIRLLGEDKAAMAWTGDAPYVDVPTGNWVAPYAGYAKEKGYTKGVGNNAFGLGLDADVYQMSTFALRGLGYSEAAGDFTYPESPEFAKSLGIVDSIATGDVFTRGDAVDILDGTVAANMKGKTETLLEKLVDDGAVTEEQLQAAAAITGNGAVTGVKLDQTSASVPMGKTLQLTASIQPSNATNKAVTWATSNSSVAKVSSTGLVTGVKNGTATITVKTADGSKTATCNLTVGGVAVTGVKLDKTTATISVGKTLQLTGTVSPSNAANKDLSWYTSGPTVASVSANGLVTGLKVGTADISVKTTDGDKMATCKVTITDEVIAVTGVKLDQTTARIAAGQTVQLSETISPSNATNQNVIWTSSRATVAKVNDYGLVTGVAAGTAIITVRTNDGSKAASCTVTVTNSLSVTGIKLDQTALTLAVGATQQLKGTITPANASNQYATWASSDSTVAKVSNGGLVTGVKAGTATITVKTTDGGLTATCKVTVTAAATAKETTIAINNMTGKTWTALYSSSSKDTDWGSKLNSGNVVNSASLKVVFTVPTGDSKFDLKADYSGGSYTFAGLELSGVANNTNFYLYLNGTTPMISTTKPTVEDTTAAMKGLVTLLNRVAPSYDALCNKWNQREDLSKDFVTEMNALTTTLDNYKKAINAGNLTLADIADGTTALNALMDSAKKLDQKFDATASAQKKVIEVTFTNNTGVEFAAVYATAAGRDDWGPALYKATVPDGGKFSITFTIDANNQIYDLRLLDLKGDAVEFQGLDFSGITSTSISHTLATDGIGNYFIQ